MKRLILIVIILGAALGALTLPAAAQATLSPLASYFPADAPVFISFRTDDPFIDQLDSLAAKIGAALPGSPMSGSLRDLLDTQVAKIQPGGTFATTIRPWLGATGAFGLTHLDLNSQQPPMTIALSLTDSAKAEKLVSGLMPADQYTVKQGDGFSEYVPTRSFDKTYLVFRSDALVITSDQALADAGGVPTSSLADNSAYQSAVNLLPADQYNGVVYIDTPTMLKAAMSQNTHPRDAAAMGMFMNMLGDLKPNAFGFTVLNDRALTIDIAAPFGASFAAMTADRTPIDPTFAQHIPAGTPLVIHSTNLYGTYQQAITNLTAMMQPSATTKDMQDMQTGLWAFGFALRGLTGMEPDAALGWMTGDYVLEASLSASASDASSMGQLMSKLPFDFAVVVKDTGDAQTFYDGLVRSLSTFPPRELTVTQATLDGGTPALVLTIQSPDMPYPVELLAAAGDGVFAFGTRRMVNAAVHPTTGLDTDASYVEAGTTLLPNPTEELYLSGAGLQPLARLAAQMSPEQGAVLQNVLGLISSASISTSVLPDKSGELVRMVWTLPQ